MKIINDMLSLFNQQTKKILSFQEGQVITGKVIKLFPKQTAEIQFGANKVFAQLDVPLNTNKQYWFQVLSGEGRIHLKMLSLDEQDLQDSKYTVEGIAKHFSIHPSKENIDLVRFFIKEKLPMSAENINLTEEWLKSIESVQDGQKAIKHMLTTNLPFTKNVFQSVYTVMTDDSLLSLINKAILLLQKQDLTENGQRLNAFLKGIMKLDLSSINGESESTMLKDEFYGLKEGGNELKTIIRSIGFSHEFDVIKLINNPENIQTSNDETLKSLLIRYLQDDPPIEQKTIFEQLVHKITGYQILSNDHGPVYSYLLQIPLLVKEQLIELTMQWNGRKKENGTMDPNYCRILFYLELDQLKETIIDMQVQNRIVPVTVINKMNELKKIAKPYIPILKQNLFSLEYTLSSVNFRTLEDYLPFQASKLPLDHSQNSPNYRGVDLKI
ncbi:hypothetical protein [Bacillus sp. 03113]|uniref:hypothetical protein n=1 Tax=Bacillus sp. 03113 TaxID=2578211 RepID=UPI0011435623|nr:hypothetical protein [Bacillus sp. 03113]